MEGYFFGKKNNKLSIDGFKLQINIRVFKLMGLANYFITNTGTKP